MTVPLMILAGGSVLAGYLGIPAVIGHLAHVPNLFEGFLHPVLAGAHHALEQVFPHPAARRGRGVGPHGRRAWPWPSPASCWRATSTRRRPELSERLAQTFAPIHRLLTNKYYVDELYGALFVRGAALGGGRRCTRWTGWSSTAATAKCGRGWA